MDELQKIKKKETITVENLWQVIESHQGETFLTVKHLPFTYTIKGGELFTDRKRKSITRSTFEKSIHKGAGRTRKYYRPEDAERVWSALYLGFVSGLWRGGREKEEKPDRRNPRGIFAVPGDFCVLSALCCLDDT